MRKRVGVFAAGVARASGDGHGSPRSPKSPTSPSKSTQAEAEAKPAFAEEEARPSTEVKAEPAPITDATQVTQEQEGAEPPGESQTEMPKREAPAADSEAKKAKADLPTSGDLAFYHLATWRDGDNAELDEAAVNKILSPMAVKYKGMNFLNPNEKVLGTILMNDSKAKTRSPALASGCVRGNACKNIWWDPTTVKAALVTCGGLCPGLNSIIRGITYCLWQEYGVRDILGITAGYNGLSDPDKHEPLKLTPEFVEEIHMKGGSILKAGRGGFDTDKIAVTLQRLEINFLFVIGGDGTQFAGNLLYEALKEKQIPVSIIGVPKSIDNDVLFFDRTFGFNSAVASAADVIRNAWVEATSCDKGVGIVKLMGRDAGFVACHAALASNLVDLCLIPEVSVKLEDIYAFVDEVIARKRHMVIAVAEGAGQEHVATGEFDSTGHPKYGDIGTFLRDKLNAHLKPQGGRTFYIDPSYIIRSVPIAPNDHIYCSRLANNAVHTAMRGYTGVCVGAIHNIVVMLPSKLIASGKKQVKLTSSTWQTCYQNCNMPFSLTGMDKA